jgi:hypothetical protein
METDIPYRLIVVIIVIALIVGLVVQQLYSMPHFPRVDQSEGFYPQQEKKETKETKETSSGLRTLPEAHVLLGFLDSARQGSSGRSAERNELELLLHKMAALVADLTGTERVVQHTRHLPFETAHDRLVVGELCGMCLQQTISSRDLDILFETWRTRGLLLLRKLCTEYQLSETDALFAEKEWTSLWTKVYDIATTQCVKPLLSAPLGPRDASPYEPDQLKQSRSYDVHYGGLSASGWNGVI